jgi:acetyl esterase/lipase
MAYLRNVSKSHFTAIKKHWFVFACAWILCAAIAAFAQTFSGVDYGGANDSSQKLDIYMPTGGAKPYAAVVWIHGGRFSSGSRTEANAAQLAGIIGPLGAAVVSIDYRLSGIAQWPAQIQDCKAAVRWIRAHASTYNFDPNRIGAAGGSAGGHLASFLGVAGNVGVTTVGSATMDLEGSVGGSTAFSSAVQAVVDMYGLSDFLTLNDTCLQNNPVVSTLDHNAADGPESILIGGPIQSNKDKCALAAPLHFVSPNNPPFCILHGKMDNLIPVCQSITFTAALRAAFSTNKKECQLIEYPTLGHGFDVNTSKDTIKAFFTRSLINVKTNVNDRFPGLPEKNLSIRFSEKKLFVSANSQATLTIADMLGRTVLCRFLSGALKQEALDLRPLGPGSFIVVLQDIQGDRRLGKVVMQ